MFYCAKCRAKNDWPVSYSKSYGLCEVCRKTAECNDVPSKYLPVPLKKPR
jgi:hypothetical protein